MNNPTENPHTPSSSNVNAADASGPSAATPAIFNHPLFGEIRTLSLTDEVWFVAADIARVLEYRDASNLVRNIKKEYRGTQILSTPSGDQQMQVINSSGLFQAVMSCRKLQAEPFQKWVLGDVLPTIARDGSYTDLRNQMGAALAQATNGSINIEVATEPTVEVSLRLLDALRNELIDSRIERRLMVRTFSRSVSQMVRIMGAQRPSNAGLDPDRPFNEDESQRAELLFRSGLSGREVSKRLNRSYAAVARFMASRPDLLQSAIQSSLI